MALVKTTDLARRGSASRPVETAAAPAPGKPTVARRTQQRSLARPQKAAERIGAATEELASGMMQAAAAAEELRRSLTQIAAGAEEAAGAAEKLTAAIETLAASLFSQARAAAETSRRRTEALQNAVIEFAAQLEDLGGSNRKRRRAAAGFDRHRLKAQSAGGGDHGHDGARRRHFGPHEPPGVQRGDRGRAGRRHRKGLRRGRRRGAGVG